MMNGLLLAAWLTLGWLPSGGVTVYEPSPMLVDMSNSALVELGAEVSWGPLFAGGSIMVPIWEQGPFNYWPQQLVSTTDVGLAFDNFRIGWRHTCAHPVTPYLPVVQWWQGELVPNFDSAYDLVYATFTVGKRRVQR
jgi:hypothetical protein